MVDAPNDRPLLVAELHYFRTPRTQWPLALARVRQMGASTVASCVPWSWHAPAHDVCDLTGATHPQRDVVGFVALCARLGLRVILKPGPFVGAALLGGGIPPWLLYQEPTIHALRPDGRPWLHSDSGLPRASYLHPLYLAHAQRWIECFCAHLTPLQHPGGPVIAVQVDNEIPADIGHDPRFRCDYNPHVCDTLWPQWLETRYGDVAALNEAWATHHESFAAVLLPNHWDAPERVESLHRYVDLDEFTDYFYNEALATVAGWLRAGGWQVPLVHNVYAEEVETPFAGGTSYRHSFEEYVHYAHWRTRLVRALSPEHPSFIAAISAAQDFFFAAPFVSGLDSICVYIAQQSPCEPGALGTFPEWAMEAPLHADGNVRQRFWNARVPLTLLDACGGWTASRPPADLGLGYSHAPEHVALWLRAAAPAGRGFAATSTAPELEALAEGADQAVLSQRIAQGLVHAGIDFDVIDLDAATSEVLARYRLVVAPAPPLLPRATQQHLAALDHLALVGDATLAFDERLAPCDLLPPEAVMRLPEGVDGATLGAMVEELGGVARYAWADADDVDVLVRHGTAPAAAYVCVANRRDTGYSGTVAYRDAAGDIEHIQLVLGPRRVALLALLGGEVLGVAFGGDASEGGWRARGLHGGISWSGGAGVVAPYAADGEPPESTPVALLLSAPQSGRFDLRRPSGWPGLAVYRLLLDGRLAPATYTVEDTHLVVPYVAEDELGQTDAYLVTAPDVPLPTRLHAYLATLLRAKLCIIESAAASAPAASAPLLHAAVTTLETHAVTPAAPNDYRAALEAATTQIAQAAQPMAAQLTALRAARAAGLPYDAAMAASLETTLEALIVARMGDG